MSGTFAEEMDILYSFPGDHCPHCQFDEQLRHKQSAEDLVDHEWLREEARLERMFEAITRNRQEVMANHMFPVVRRQKVPEFGKLRRSERRFLNRLMSEIPDPDNF